MKKLLVKVCMVSLVSVISFAQPVKGQGGVFRGDCDTSGTISIADAFKILSHKFLGEEVDCVDACNADGIDSVSLADAFFILTFKFLGGPAPEPALAFCEAIPAPLTWGARMATFPLASRQSVAAREMRAQSTR